MKRRLSMLLVTAAAAVSMTAAAMPVGAVSLRDVFDPVYYAEANPDVAKAVGTNPQALLRHYMKYGFAEGRSFSPLLDLSSYKRLNPDLAAAFGSDAESYVEHYFTYGLSEHRKAGASFDPVAYAEAYPDVKAAFGDDYAAVAAHYLNKGFEEGRTAGVEPVIVASVSASKKGETLPADTAASIIKGEVAVMPDGSLSDSLTAVTRATKAALAKGNTTAADAFKTVKKLAEAQISASAKDSGKVAEAMESLSDVASVAVSAAPKLQADIERSVQNIAVAAIKLNPTATDGVLSAVGTVSEEVESRVEVITNPAPAPSTSTSSSSSYSQGGSSSYVPSYNGPSQSTPQEPSQEPSEEPSQEPSQEPSEGGSSHSPVEGELTETRKDNEDGSYDIIVKKGYHTVEKRHYAADDTEISKEVHGYYDSGIPKNILKYENDVLKNELVFGDSDPLVPIYSCDYKADGEKERWTEYSYDDKARMIEAKRWYYANEGYDRSTYEYEGDSKNYYRSNDYGKGGADSDTVGIYYLYTWTDKGRVATSTQYVYYPNNPRKGSNYVDDNYYKSIVTTYTHDENGYETGSTQEQWSSEGVKVK